MRQTSWSRMRHQAIGAVVLAVCAAPIPALATAAHAQSGSAVRSQSVVAKRGPTHVSGFDTRALTIKAGRRIADDVIVTPHAKRVVLVQARRPGSADFKTLSTGHSSASGKFHAVYVASTAGTWRFRLLVRRTATREQGVTGMRVVKTVDLTAPEAVTGVGFEATSSTIKLTWVNPTATDFSGVTIRRTVGPNPAQSPTGGTGVTDTGQTDTTFTDHGLTDNTQYTYALFAHDASSNFARSATVTLRTQRLPVTGLTTTQVTRTSIALAWTNPDDVDFTGVTIRRADGPTAPVSATDGTPVSDVLSPESTFTDSGLTPDTQYSYAVFATDGAHFSAGATLSSRTRAPGTQAVLKVNPLTTNSPKVTIGSTVAFDASDSLPADGLDFSAWSIDFGDGTPVETFTGPFGPADVFNTEHTFTGNGDRTVTLTVTDSNNNTDADVVVVHVFNAPTVSVQAAGSAVVNVPLDLDVSAQTPNGTAFTSYQMDVSGPEVFFISRDGAPPGIEPVEFTIPGTYTIDVTVTNDAGAVVFADPVIVVVGP